MNMEKLKEQILKRKMTQKEIAKSLGMSESTFRRKAKNDEFGIIDANIMIEILHIDNPEDIFFDKQLT